MIDRKEFALLFANLMKAKGRNIDGEMLEVWFNFLKEYSIHDLKIGFGRMARSSQFPEVGRIIEFMEPDIDFLFDKIILNMRRGGKIDIFRPNIRKHIQPFLYDLRRADNEFKINEIKNKFKRRIEHERNQKSDRGIKNELPGNDETRRIM